MMVLGELGKSFRRESCLTRGCLCSIEDEELIPGGMEGSPRKTIGYKVESDQCEGS